MLGDVRRVTAGRKPKLEGAQRPNPSGGAPLPTRSRQPAVTTSRLGLMVRPQLPAPKPSRARRDEWKGNVALILAIAALVGVATFVMVRERVEDERVHPNAGNAHLAR
jgi:hypothetical protein